jgi:hypothetical protein
VPALAPLMLSLVLLAAPGPVLATHTPDTRYSVRGFVLDEDGRAMRGRVVWLFLADRPLASANTDFWGWYSLVAELGDRDIGSLLRLRVADHEVEMHMRATPGDRSTPRIHRANVVGGALVEERLWRFRVPGWAYPLVALLVLGWVVTALERRRRRRRRIARDTAHGPASAHGRPTRRRRRR